MANARIRILPYRQGSKSAKALAEALGGKVLKLEGSKFTATGGDLIVNWGCSNEGIHAGIAIAKWLWESELTYLNAAKLIRHASNKLNFFKMMREGGYNDIIPQWWTSKDDIPDDCFPVVCRTVLAGHSGEGIVIANTRDDLVDAPLYVQYKKKKDEYRVHLGKSPAEIVTGTEGNPYVINSIAIQRKARRTDCENPNWQVRNHANGFVFVRNDVNPPSCVVNVARKALEVSGLDFGAVDVIYNEHEDKSYVLEINTAPGLEGQTVVDYANFFKGL